MKKSREGFQEKSQEESLNIYSGRTFKKIPGAIPEIIHDGIID